MKKLIAIIVSLIFFTSSVFAQNCEANERPSITFIIGENQTDGFFALAKEYYLTNSLAKTDIVVDNCQSLLSVRNYLEEAWNCTNKTWGKINFVLHSNQWTGMSVTITVDGDRTTVDNIFAKIKSGEFAPLSNEVIDEQTSMNFVTCGLGKNKDLLYALKVAFSGFDDQQAIIKSSEDYISFSYDEDQKVSTRNLKPFYAFYKTAYKPSDLQLRTQLENRYPNVPIDWLTAVQTKQATIDQDIFHTKFNIPVQWNVQLDAPTKDLELKSEFDKIEFIRAQEDLMETLDKFDIPIEKYRWQMKVSEEAGKAQVQINGKSTVLCVLTES